MSHSFTPPYGYAQWLTWKVDEEEKRARWDRHVNFIERAWIRKEQGLLVTTEKIDQACDRHTDLTRTKVIATLVWHTTHANWHRWDQKGSGQLIIQTVEVSTNKRRKCTAVTYYVAQRIVLMCSHPFNRNPFFNEDFYWNSIPLFSRRTNHEIVQVDSESDIEIIEV